MMMDKTLSANLWRYQAFQVSITAFFFMPIIVLFWQQNGLDAFDVYLLQGLFAVAVVILEVPTGMVADRIGKRASLIFAAALIAFGMVFYSLAASFFAFLLGEVILAVGVALVSGADSALLYDTLKKLDRADDYSRLEGNARGLQLASLAVFTVFGGFVGEFSYRATLWLSAIGPALAFFIALGFVDANPPETHGEEDGDEKAETPTTYSRLISNAWRFVIKHRLVRWHVMFLAVLTGSATWLLWLYQPYMKLIGLPIYAFGLAFALFNLFASLMSSWAHRFDRRFGRTGTLIVLMVLQVGPLLLMATVVMPFSFLFILGHQAVRGISRPVVSERILRYTYADKRATVLSLGSLAGRLFFAITAPLIGWFTKTHTITSSLLFQAALLSIILVALLFAYRRIPAKYFAVKESVLARQ